MTEAVLRLKRGHDRPRVHPWVFKGDVADVAGAEPGGAVTVVDSAGRFLGRGFYNSGPALCCRIATRVDEALDEAFFARRLAAAVALRTSGEPPALGRLVWSEADALPGLVVDRYGPVLVLQCQTLAMAQHRGALARALRGVAGELAIFNRDDPLAARIEGFAPAAGWLDRVGPGHVVVEEGPVRFGVSIGAGHKTGLYLDQRDNRGRVASLARGRDVLDAFAYTAGFACHALRGGARRALCLESSSEALAGAQANLELNGLAGRAELRGGNAFDELRRLERDHTRFGLVVLDPPPFARGRTTLDSALRGYKEINLRAMRLLEPGGRLLTFSCSHHVTDTLFEHVCREAAADVGATLRVLSTLTQAADHPVLLNVPETRYLKGLLLELV
jgi:23S rRNA (cytosine1962-C5)-methyltransferase